MKEFGLISEGILDAIAGTKSDATAGDLLKATRDSEAAFTNFIFNKENKWQGTMITLVLKAHDASLLTEQSETVKLLKTYPEMEDLRSANVEMQEGTANHEQFEKSFKSTLTVFKQLRNLKKLSQPEPSAAKAPAKASKKVQFRLFDDDPDNEKMK